MGPKILCIIRLRGQSDYICLMYTPQSDQTRRIRLYFGSDYQRWCTPIDNPIVSHVNGDRSKRLEYLFHACAVGTYGHVMTLTLCVLVMGFSKKYSHIVVTTRSVLLFSYYQQQLDGLLARCVWLANCYYLILVSGRHWRLAASVSKAS